MDVNPKNNVIQTEDFNVKENRCYNALVLMNDYQDQEGW